MNIIPQRVRHCAGTAICEGALAFALAGLGGGCVVQTESDEEDPEDEEEADGDGVPYYGDDQPASTPDDDRSRDGEPTIPHSGSTESCCENHPGGGCDGLRVESCVCGLDPQCCTASWDTTCVMTARHW